MNTLSPDDLLLFAQVWFGISGGLLLVGLFGYSLGRSDERRIYFQHRDRIRRQADRPNRPAILR